MIKLHRQIKSYRAPQLRQLLEGGKPVEPDRPLPVFWYHMVYMHVGFEDCLVKDRFVDFAMALAAACLDCCDTLVDKPSFRFDKICYSTSCRAKMAKSV